MQPTVLRRRRTSSSKSVASKSTKDRFANYQQHSVLADEAADCGNKEQMPIVLRYVDNRKEINERFIKYVGCKEGVTGEALAVNVEDTLEKVGLPLADSRGEGYDGASSMSMQ